MKDELKLEITRGFPKTRGTDPHNKDYSILGSILGPPILGNHHLPPRVLTAIRAEAVQMISQKWEHPHIDRQC